MNALRYLLAIATALVIHGFAFSHTEKNREIKASLQQQNNGLQLQIQQVAKAAPKTQLDEKKDKNSSNTKETNKTKVVEKKQAKQPTKQPENKAPKKISKPSKQKVQEKSKPVKKQSEKIKQHTAAKQEKITQKKNKQKDKVINKAEKKPEIAKTEPIVDQNQKNTEKNAQESISQTSQSLPKLIDKPLFSAQPTAVKYPKLARKRGWQGIVLVEVWIDDQGKQVKQIIIESAGHKSLDDAALKAIKQWQFASSVQGNVAVAHRVRIPVNFQLK